MQQSDVSSQQFAGQTKRRNEGFRKRVVTARFTCRATGTGLPFGSCRGAHVDKCHRTPCVTVHTVKAVASRGVQLHTFFLSALGAGDQPASRSGRFTSDCRAPDSGSRAGLVDSQKRKVCCACRKANPLSSSP